MAKLTFPSVLSRNYMGIMSEMRMTLTYWRRLSERAPGIIPDMRRQVSTLMFAIGGFFVDGTVIVVKNSTGAKTSNGLADVTETTGVLNKVDLPATDTIVNNTMALTGVVPSGAYTTTVTFTVAGGLITAIVLS